MSASTKIPLIDLAPAIAELRPALDAAYARVMDSGWVLLGKELAAPTRPGVGQIKPRAKRVIFLFMEGGPSHLDLFDPKPALKKFAGTAPSRDIVNQIEFADQIGVGYTVRVIDREESPDKCLGRAAIGTALRMSAEPPFDRRCGGGPVVGSREHQFATGPQQPTRRP